MTPWLAFAVAACLGACASDEPAPEPRQAPVEVAAPLLTPEHGPELGSLDAFGNLRGSGESILGFEVPMGAERNQRAHAFPVMYVGANEQRLLRFFRSRGHTLIKKMTSWTVAHSHRTLIDEDAESLALKKATIVMTQGPGSGFTLRFHRSSPIAPSKRPVELLVEAELKTSKEKTAERGSAPTPSPAPLKSLRAEAFGDRPNTSKAVDLSQRIYEHMKAKGDDRFRD
jgi:hypothetical protein